MIDILLAATPPTLGVAAATVAALFLKNDRCGDWSPTLIRDGEIVPPRTTDEAAL